MKKVIRHQCELCGAFFVDEADALTCEESHVKVKSTNPIYDQDEDGCPNYPQYIEVKFESGNVATYELISMDCEN